jgi:hypothetical protein
MEFILPIVSIEALGDWSFTKYLQEKKTTEAKLFANCLFFLGAYLSDNLKDQKKYLDIINAIQNVDKLHPFPIARKIMSNVNI